MLNGYNLTPAKRISRKWLVLIIFIIVIAFIVLYVTDYHNRTGLLPISGLNSPENILPPELHPTEQTYEQVMSFIKSDDTDTIEYGEGFNCVDSSFRLWLNARWQGIAAYPMRVNYEDSPTHHMVVIFPSADRGDVVIESQGDIQVRPRIGKFYNGKMVNGLYILKMSWIPIEGSPALDSGYEIE